ncbi:STAS domain-containing protein [Nostoc sp. FACHB-110]|uniref:STAS domain-containing protein n=1 Tax=Nostoc sp. FACHB-110 TaxID=2692834 RepID=UPI001684ADBF|nr:STAS domain-containing protein [Nostoc sp. FACHB-110]MBD2438407.1 STAS domain-containing protein [Nostoc sp. FACHB-110]
MSPKVTVIELDGILDGIRGNLLRREVSNVLESGADIVLIDMKHVKFIDSSGLGSLVSAMQLARGANAQLFICSISEQVKMLFELTKVNKIFQIFADINDFKNNIISALNET